MNSLAERLDRCEREIACAIAESKRSHTPMEHTGILLWEMDWRVERENILREIASAAAAAAAGRCAEDLTELSFSAEGCQCSGLFDPADDLLADFLV